MWMCEGSFIHEVHLIGTSISEEKQERFKKWRNDNDHASNMPAVVVQPPIAFTDITDVFNTAPSSFQATSSSSFEPSAPPAQLMEKDEAVGVM